MNQGNETGALKPNGRKRAFVFVNVNVISFANQDEILHNETVVVAGYRIVNIEDGSTKIPEDVFQIDCLGKYYLMPGLADMHVHAWNEADLILFLVNGVTTIRNMWGSYRQLSWRKRITEGKLFGPTIYTAGPLIDGEPPIWNSSKVVKNSAEARDEVGLEKARGYDFVKVYNRLSAESYEAIVDAARMHGLPVAGHVPDAVGLHSVLNLRQDSIEHLTGYINAIESDDSPFGGIADMKSRRAAVDYIDRKKIPQVAKETFEAGTWNCVTLIVLRKFVSKEESLKFLEEPEMKFVPPSVLASWDPSKDFRIKTMTSEDFKQTRKADLIRKELVAELHRAGAHILLGTDTPNPFVIPGFSIHEELRNLVDAGLSPYEAIKAGTSDAAKFLKASDEFGSIRAGLRADLILTEANPLEDVRNVARRIGVMVRGKWFTEKELLKMLDDLVASYTFTIEKAESLLDPILLDAQLYGEYLVNSSDTLVGAERISITKLSDSKILVSSQALFNSPPDFDRFSFSELLSEEWNPISFQFDGFDF